MAADPKKRRALTVEDERPIRELVRLHLVRTADFDLWHLPAPSQPAWRSGWFTTFKTDQRSERIYSLAGSGRSARTRALPRRNRQSAVVNRQFPIPPFPLRYMHLPGQNP
jgi:hypothetical protein